MYAISHHISEGISVSCMQTSGSRHREQQQPCEDTVFLHTADDYLFCGIADGQSGAPYGREGGMVCLEAVCDYIGSTGIENILNTPFPDELPCSITKAYRQALLSLAARKEAPLQDFSSTLLALAADLRSGRYILLHLGDGCAVSISNSDEFTIISAPDNGLSSHHTWLTASDNAVSHLRIRFGSLENRKRFLLLSDGATCFCRGRNIPWRTRELLRQYSQSQLWEYLVQSTPADDATCILIDCRNENL